MKNLIWTLSLLLPAGCQTYPGFHASIGFDLPPSQQNTVALHALPTAMGTTYAIESPAQVPVTTRQYQVVSPPVIATNPGPVRQLLPMPRENLPPAPCGPQGGE